VDRGIVRSAVLDCVVEDRRVRCQPGHWQTATKVGSVLNSNLTAPHPHRAVCFFAMVSFPCVSLRVAGGAVERKACQPAVDGVDDDGAFSNARRNPLNRVGTDVPYGKDARNIRFVR